MRDEVSLQWEEEKKKESLLLLLIYQRFTALKKKARRESPKRGDAKRRCLTAALSGISASFWRVLCLLLFIPPPSL